MAGDQRDSALLLVSVADNCRTLTLLDAESKQSAMLSLSPQQFATLVRSAILHAAYVTSPVPPFVVVVAFCYANYDDSSSLFSVDAWSYETAQEADKVARAIESHIGGFARMRDAFEVTRPDVPELRVPLSAYRALNDEVAVIDVVNAVALEYIGEGAIGLNFTKLLNRPSGNDGGTYRDYLGTLSRKLSFA